MKRMTSPRTPKETISALRAGPSANTGTITTDEVLAAAEKLPKSYAGALSALLYKLADAQLKAPGKNMVAQFETFAEPWVGGLSDIRAKFFASYLSAFSRSVEFGLDSLDWKNQERAQHIAETLSPEMPPADTVEGLAWLPLVGQLQSTYSRDIAAETLATARQHEHAYLIADFYWDTGALTYYSEREVQQRRVAVPSLSEMLTLSTSNEAKSDNAIVISVDPNFFRIYGPMILFNAQQLSSTDFVLILCAERSEAQQVLDDANEYLAALSRFNKQALPSNLRIEVVDVPEWVQSSRTFYACARFLVLPELLHQYETVYAMDADLFMIKDPQPFMSTAPKASLSVPETQGLLGVPPWRRYMAGNMVVNRDFLGSTALERLFDYMSVGLTESSSWMLDQNAIAYAVEGAEPGKFEKLSKARPSQAATIMRLWERNYKKATN